MYICIELHISTSTSYEMTNVYEVCTFSQDYPGIKHTLIREMLFHMKVTRHSTIYISTYEANMTTCGDTKPGCMAENPSSSISNPQEQSAPHTLAHTSHVELPLHVISDCSST